MIGRRRPTSTSPRILTKMRLITIVKRELGTMIFPLKSNYISDGSIHVDPLLYVSSIGEEPVAVPEHARYNRVNHKVRNTVVDTLELFAEASYYHSALSIAFSGAEVEGADQHSQLTVEF